VERWVCLNIHTSLSHGQSDDGLLIERAANIERLGLGDDRQPVREYVKHSYFTARGQHHAEAHGIGVFNDQHHGAVEMRGHSSRSRYQQLAWSGFIAL